MIELKFKVHPNGGSDSEQAKVQFSNGYGASVITGASYYTREDAPFELAVINRKGELQYGTPITDDVLGYLTAEEVQSILQDIKELPSV